MSFTRSGSSLLLSLKRSLSEVTRRASQRFRTGNINAVEQLNEAQVNDPAENLLRNSVVPQGLDEDDDIIEEEKVEDDQFG